MNPKPYSAEPSSGFGAYSISVVALSASLHRVKEDSSANVPSLSVNDSFPAWTSCMMARLVNILFSVAGATVSFFWPQPAKTKGKSRSGWK